MKSFLKIAFCLAAAAMSLSCKPEEEILPVQDGFPELLQAYKDGAVVTNITLSGNSAAIYFENAGSTTIRNIVVQDCRNSDPMVIGVTFEKEWLVGGSGTGMFKNENIIDDVACVFFLYYTEKEVVAHLTNGRVLHFLIKQSEPEPEPEPEIPSRGLMPVVYLTTKNKAAITSKETYVEGTIKLEGYSGETELDATMKIRGRGNSTWGMPKKPWKIKLDEKASIFGMPKDKEWCLLANYADKSLIRNLTAMEISRICGFAWTPGMQTVEVYLNGTYQGVYSLSEHKKVSKDRVNIDLDAGDLYFEIETNQDEPCCWYTDHGVPMMFSEPSEPDKDTEAYAKQFFKDFESTLWDNSNKKDFSNPDHHYSQYIDVESFINYYIIQELTKNIDGQLKKSTFITLPKGGKLTMYHVWDFDLTMGNCDYYDNDGLNKGYGNTAKGWWIKDRASNGVNHGWYYRLFMDPEFKKAVQDRWKELYPELKERIPQFIKEESDFIIQSGADTRNFKKWNILKQYVWPNYKIPGTYKGEVDWLLEFYNARLEWINSNIDKI